jgi:enoyl-CoA hydratase/carnithine racemase
LLTIAIDGEIAVLTMNRPEKRNAMSDQLMGEIDNFFSAPPADVKAVVLTGAGGHFCAGLDLSEHVSRAPDETMRHSRQWHAVMDKIQFGGLAVVSAMAGAVLGGGLELAAATHVRIAEQQAFFQMPEGRRGIFVGGGGSVRIARLIGAGRLVEMMLTGRRYQAEDALSLGLAHYVCEEGASLDQAIALAKQISGNAPLSNYFIIQAISRISDMSQADGLFAESLCAALSQTSPDALEGLAAFLEKRAPAFR